MVIQRSSQEEVARLVADLLGRDAVARESAAARLAIIGQRAVGRLVTALDEARDPEQVATVLLVLERVADARALAPATERLRNRALPVALAAVAAVRPHLVSPHASVADAATAALTDLVLDVSQPDEARGAALDALHDLPTDTVEPVLRRLKDDPSARLQHQAGWAPAGARPHPLEPLAGESWGDDPEELRRSVEAEGATAPLPVLHHLVEHARQREPAEPSPDRRAQWRVLRASVHQVLANRGSRVALYDLRETIERSPETLAVGMVAALAQVGDASCLEPLASAISRTEDGWLKAQLAEAIAAIVRRERLTRRHAAMKRLLARHPELSALLASRQ